MRLPLFLSFLLLSQAAAWSDPARDDVYCIDACVPMVTPYGDIIDVNATVEGDDSFYVSMQLSAHPVATLEYYVFLQAPGQNLSWVRAAIWDEEPEQDAVWSYRFGTVSPWVDYGEIPGAIDEATATITMTVPRGLPTMLIPQGCAAAGQEVKYFAATSNGDTVDLAPDTGTLTLAFPICPDPHVPPMSLPRCPIRCNDTLTMPESSTFSLNMLLNFTAETTLRFERNGTGNATFQLGSVTRDAVGMYPVSVDREEFIIHFQEFRGSLSYSFDGLANNETHPGGAMPSSNQSTPGVNETEKMAAANNETPMPVWIVTTALLIAVRRR